MERFVQLTTTNERARVVKATNALESAGIPVIVQHVFKTTDKSERTDSNCADFRLMVPDRYSASANQVLGPLIVKNS